MESREEEEESITTDLQPSWFLQISSTTELRELHEWVSMVTAASRHTSPRSMQRCSGVKQPPLDSRAVEERSLEDQSSSPSGDLMEESGFGGCRRTVLV